MAAKSTVSLKQKFMVHFITRCGNLTKFTRKTSLTQIIRFWIERTWFSFFFLFYNHLKFQYNMNHGLKYNIFGQKNKLMKKGNRGLIRKKYFFHLYPWFIILMIEFVLVTLIASFTDNHVLEKGYQNAEKWPLLFETVHLPMEVGDWLVT